MTGNEVNGYNLIFILCPVRLKALDNKEKLEIRIEGASGSAIGKVLCDILNLENDLYRLKEYGTGFRRGEMISIRSIIDEHYRKIAVEDVDTKIANLDACIADIVRMYADYIPEYISDQQDIQTKDTYNMLVADFKEYLQDSDYRVYDYREVKEKLRDLEYTKCNPGRSDRTIKDKEGKTRKVVSFHKKAIDDIDRAKVGNNED